MTDIGKLERDTQNRVIALFRDTLGYRFLGDKSDSINGNIEEPLLRTWLEKRKVAPTLIERALQRLRVEADNPTRDVYDSNEAVYKLLRYGVPVKAEAGEHYRNVWLIDWAHPEANDFALAEEVTLCQGLERRPDLVLYVNGIAVGVIELKRSIVGIGEGIRQLISNQRPEFNPRFFSTVQLVFAGNDTEGLRYATVGTPEKFFLTWKEDEADDREFKLDKYLGKMCNKARLIELMHDFVLFEGGVKKVPRAHQYFGVKAAQEYVARGEGGIIWHTQGSGKSIVMLLLARWILETNPAARVLIVTDRDELDKQIERVFQDAGEPMARTRTSRDLMTKLGEAKPRLLCSLVHKFGQRDVDNFDAWIKDIEAQPNHVQGEVFVFVDECHRTQKGDGKLHRAMKALLPDAVFIGFTGTPLLKKDAKTSLEVFGNYIHTYKFGEAVEDGVVLDLTYEARDIPQELGPADEIDQWFEKVTRGLNDWKKAALREQWGTMQKVLSSRSRMERVVRDIVKDFMVRPRLESERGNAMLVASSILEACRYYALFQQTVLKGKCGLVTSYNPYAGNVSKEDTGANSETEKQVVYRTYIDLLKNVRPEPGQSQAKTYEDQVRKRFVEQPAQMKLLVVVDKLLTGFDAPPCTFLYIDKSMADHGLFQAICRTNRLDGEDKPVGCIVDYKDLFKKVGDAMRVYTSELDASAGGTDPDVLLKSRVEKGRERFEQARESLALQVAPVAPPKGELEQIHYFCGNTEIPTDLKQREPLRVALYKSTAALLRAYAMIAHDLPAAGYSKRDMAEIKTEIDHYSKLRDTIRQASGETLDMKPYEADMRYLLDAYVEAGAVHTISPFEGLTLLELIVQCGVDEAVKSLPEGIRGNKDAVAETITNNVRSKIVKEHLNDPQFYDRMSKLLGEILADLKARRIEYAAFLKQIAELARQVQAGKADDTPEPLDTPGKRALYNTLQMLVSATNPQSAHALGDEQGDYDVALNQALAIDTEIRRERPDGWRGSLAKERIIKGALFNVLGDEQQVETLFPIVRAQPEY